MDKYEYNLKIEQLRKYALEGYFDEEALEICESINWKKEKNIEVLSMAAKVYGKCRKYEKELFVLERIYKLSNAKRRTASRIIKVALEFGDYDTASEYLDEYKQMVPRDKNNILWEYRLKKGILYSKLQEETTDSKKKEIEGMKEIIPILQKYVDKEHDEVGMYELAEAYHRIGDGEACVAMCDQLSIWFSYGPYVEKALRLKTVYEPLSEAQRDMIQNRAKYEEKVKEVINDWNATENVPSLTTKEEVKEKEEKKAKREAKFIMKTEETIEVKANFEVFENNFSETAKSIPHKSKKVDVDSLEKVHQVKEDYKQKLEQVQEEEKQREADKNKSNQVEKKKNQQNMFTINVSDEIDVTQLGDLTSVGHFVIQSDIEKQGVLLVKALVEEIIQQGQTISSEIVYTSGEKLADVGVAVALEDVSNVVLVVKHAGSLSEINTWELQNVMESFIEKNIRMVLIDTRDGIGGIWKKNIALQSTFQSIFVVQTMTVDELADYAVEYIERKNYVLHEMAYIPLYEIIGGIVDDKKGNEKNRVEKLMDSVIQNVSERTFMQIMRKAFFMHHNDQGKTILYERDFG